MEEKNNISGYCTITYKSRLYTKQVECLKKTKDLFNEVILIYYKLLLENQEFLNLSNQYCLRELEKLTIKSRDGKLPKNYIDLDLPTYFRRAAINQAIGSVRNYFSLYERYLAGKAKEPSLAKQFNNSLLFYKGMYRNFSRNHLEIKLWNGDTWNWYKAKIKNEKFDEKTEILSPTIVLNNKFIMIHIPVKQIVDDVRTVKERMQDDNLRIMGVSFSNYDNFAICTVIEKDGSFIKAKFISGGNKYKNRISQICSTIKKHRQVNSKLTEKDHKRYWDKLKNIDNYTAHKVSREILNFAKENSVKVISITKIEDDVSTFVQKVGKHSPIYLRRKIINFLQYKSFKEGILITTVRQNYIASKCYKCRGNVKRKNEMYFCEKGHQGNYYFNTAMNIAIMSLKKFGKEVKKINPI